MEKTYIKLFEKLEKYPHLMDEETTKTKLKE